MNDSPHAPRPTLRSLAKVAGVSRSAVSMALRNHPRVSAATAKRIQALADKLGYKPDPEVSRLMAYLQRDRPKKTAGTLAWLSPWPWARLREAPPMYRAAHRGAAKQAEALGYRLDYFRATGSPEEDRQFTRILSTRGIRGVVVGAYPEPHQLLQLDWDKFAAVTLGFSADEPETHRVANDHFQASTLAMERVTALGYLRPGLIISERQDARVRHRWRAGYAAFQERCLPRSRHVRVCSATAATDIMRWFRSQRPDVVIATGTEPLNILKAAGVAVPREVGYVLLDLEAPDARYSGIVQHPEVTGAALVTVLVGMILRNEYGLPTHPRLILTQNSWNEGASTARRKDSSKG